jgi:hypothetical protein
MSQTYTISYAIPTGGMSGGCMALHNSTASNITAIIVPFHNPAGATASVLVVPGDVLPIRSREIKSASSTGLFGLN